MASERVRHNIERILDEVDQAVSLDDATQVPPMDPGILRVSPASLA